MASERKILDQIIENIEAARIGDYHIAEIQLTKAGAEKLEQEIKAISDIVGTIKHVRFGDAPFACNTAVFQWLPYDVDVLFIIRKGDILNVIDCMNQLENIEQ